MLQFASKRPSPGVDTHASLGRVDAKSMAVVGSGHAQAAAHREGLAGHVARVVGGEERHDARDLLGLRDPTHRDRAREGVDELGVPVADLLEQGGVGRPRAHRCQDHTEDSRLWPVNLV